MNHVYIYRDDVSGAFGAPVLAPNPDVIKREMMVGNVPEYVLRDVSVIDLGVFHDDPVCPRIEAYDCPVVVLHGSSLIPLIKAAQMKGDVDDAEAS